MMWATPALAMALVLGAPDIKNRALADGIQLYDSLDYAGALQALTQALDKPSTKRDFARIHLYIGLIQHRYKLIQDAEASFTKALNYDARVKLPKGATKGAKALFRKLQKAKLGDSIDVLDARVDDPRDTRPKKKPKAVHRHGDIDEDESGPSTPDLTDSSTAAMARDAGGARTGSSSGGSGAIAMAGRGGRSGGVVDSSEEPEDDLPAVRSFAPAEPGSRGVAPPTAGSTEVRESSPGPVVGWISIGIGVAAVATGITLGALSGRNGSAALTEPVASRAEQLHNTAVQQRTFALVSFGVSGTALGLAAVLFLTE